MAAVLGRPPDEPVYSSVLRDAMCVDDADTAGVYFGTRTGEVFASRDEGESWTSVRAPPARRALRAGRRRGLTMKVIVRIPTPLRNVVEGAAQLDVELADGATVEALLDQLGTDWPALERRIRDEQRRLRQHVNVFVGADNVRDLDEQATHLADGAEVSVIGAISGGCCQLAAATTAISTRHSGRASAGTVTSVEAASDPPMNRSRAAITGPSGSPATT